MVYSISNFEIDVRYMAGKSTDRAIKDKIMSYVGDSVPNAF